MTALYSYEEAAKAYNVPEEMLRKAVANGTLRCIKNGPNWIRFREETIDRWLAGLDKVN